MIHFRLFFSFQWLVLFGCARADDVCGRSLSLLKGPLSYPASARALIDDLIARQWSLRTLPNCTPGTTSPDGGASEAFACEVRACVVPEGFLAFVRAKPGAPSVKAGGAASVPSLAEVLPVEATRTERQSAMARALHAWHGGGASGDRGSASPHKPPRDGPLTVEGLAQTAALGPRSSAGGAATSPLSFSQVARAACAQPWAAEKTLPVWSFAAHVAAGGEQAASKRARVDAIQAFCDRTAPAGAGGGSTDGASSEPGAPPPRIARYATTASPEEPSPGFSQEVVESLMKTDQASLAPEIVRSYGQAVASAMQASAAAAEEGAAGGGAAPMTRTERRTAMAKHFVALQASDAARAR
jgi:hypothetical protein